MIFWARRSGEPASRTLFAAFFGGEGGFGRVLPQTRSVGGHMHGQAFAVTVGDDLCARPHRTGRGRGNFFRARVYSVASVGASSRPSAMAWRGRGFVIGQRPSARMAPRRVVHQRVQAGCLFCVRDAVVVEVMRPSDPDRPGAKVPSLSGVFVGDEADAAALCLWGRLGISQSLADDGAYVHSESVHRDRAIDQHGFGAGCRDLGDIAPRLFVRVILPSFGPPFST